MTQWQQPQPYQQPQHQWPPHYQHMQPPTKHSGLGISAFIIAILAGVLAFVMVVIAGVLESQTPGGIDEESPEAVAVGLGIIGAGLLALVGAVLGLIGCILPGRKKVFAILGLVFSALVVLGLLGLMVLGLAAG